MPSVPDLTPPAPPSREAEIAARLTEHIIRVPSGPSGRRHLRMVPVAVVVRLIADSEAALRAHLQQARQESDEAKASEQRQYDQSVEATVEMLQLRTALQQAREALKALTEYCKHSPICSTIGGYE